MMPGSEYHFLIMNSLSVRSSCLCCSFGRDKLSVSLFYLFICICMFKNKEDAWTCSLSNNNVAVNWKSEDVDLEEYGKEI